MGGQPLFNLVGNAFTPNSALGSSFTLGIDCISIKDVLEMGILSDIPDVLNAV